MDLLLRVLDGVAVQFSLDGSSVYCILVPADRSQEFYLSLAVLVQPTVKSFFPAMCYTNSIQNRNMI